MSIRMLRDFRDHCLETRNAARRDANLDQLIATDDDAALTFQHGDFTRCLRDPEHSAELNRRINAYLAAKLKAGREDLYDQLFA